MAGRGGIRGNTPVEISNWERVVDLVHDYFGESQIVKENTWQAVVLITKGERDYSDIGLVEAMWKVVAAILYCRLTASITFHDFLHGFWVGCSTGTATLETKLIQHLAELREEVLYLIFLNLNKAYDALDRSRCLKYWRAMVWDPEHASSSGHNGVG